MSIFTFIVLGINTSVAPMYLSEIAPVKLRGALGTLNQFGIVTGILLGNIFGLSEVGKASIFFVMFEIPECEGKGRLHTLFCCVEKILMKIINVWLLRASKTKLNRAD